MDFLYFSFALSEPVLQINEYFKNEISDNTVYIK